MKETLKLIIACAIALALLLNSITWLTGRADWVVPILTAHASSMAAKTTGENDHVCGHEEHVDYETYAIKNPYVIDAEPLTYQEAMRVIQINALRIEQLEQKIYQLEAEHAFADPCGLDSVECPGENSVLAP